MSVLLNQGNGTFAAAINSAAGKGPSGIAAADLNGDGKPDLAVTSNSSSSVGVLLNLGNGAFGAPVPTPWARSPSRSRRRI